jgi:hypothetical protein
MTSPTNGLRTPDPHFPQEGVAHWPIRALEQLREFHHNLTSVGEVSCTKDSNMAAIAQPIIDAEPINDRAGVGQGANRFSKQGTFNF